METMPGVTTLEEWGKLVTKMRRLRRPGGPPDSIQSVFGIRLDSVDRRWAVLY